MSRVERDPGPGPPHLVAIGFLAGSVLAFEIVLLRLFEFSHWHHFAGLTIALALLGFGAAGSLLGMLGARTSRFGDRWMAFSLAVAAAGYLVVLMLHAFVSLRPVVAVWDVTELARLLAIDFAAFVPFFGAGLALGQVFARWPEHPTRLYAANLAGSGLGTLLGTLLLALIVPEAALAVIALLLAGFGVWFAFRQRLPKPFAVGGAALALISAWLAWQPPELAVSDFKVLARVLELPGAEVLQQRPGLPGRLTVVRAPSLRFAPGLSLEWTGAVPASDALVVGSDRLVPIERSYSAPVGYSSASLVGLPLQLKPAGPVAVLGSGTWATPAHAIGRDLVWVEPDRRVMRIAAERGLGATPVAESPYRFITTSRRRFAVISLDYAFDGRDAASEDFLLTRQGVRAALERLEPDGLLAIPLKVEYPPRQAPRLLATIDAALSGAGAGEPAGHVAALRGMQSIVFLVSRQPFGDEEISTIRTFAERYGFDRVWHSGLRADDANRHHVLDEPLFFETARAIFAGRPMPAQARWFETRPATTNRPYFWRAMKWSGVDDLFGMLGSRAASHLDWTLVMSAIAVVAATAAAAVLIVAPLGRMPRASTVFRRIDVVGYFGLLGLGFMLVEMVVLQRTAGLLEPAVLVAAVVFAVFMIGAGLGSITAPVEPGLPAVRKIFGLLLAGGALAVIGLWGFGQALLAVPQWIRIGLIVLLLLPLTFAMGRPFPWALSQISTTPAWLPWGWAVNGFASVVAASLATLISIEAGQGTTLVAGAACYAGVWLIAGMRARRPAH